MFWHNCVHGDTKKKQSRSFQQRYIEQQNNVLLMTTLATDLHSIEPIIYITSKRALLENSINPDSDQGLHCFN